MLICIKTKYYNDNEFIYIIKLIFKFWLNIDYCIKENRDEDIIIEMNGKSIIFESEFFSKKTKYWMKKELLPNRENIRIIDNELIPNKYLKIGNINDIAIIYGKDQINFKEKYIKCYIDIFGTIFFFLSRYEEAICDKYDNHHRFSSKNSVLYNSQLILRPVVNEYIEVLWLLMKIQWPNLERKERSFRMFLTHDVDFPFKYARMPISNLSKSIFGDLIKRYSLKLAIEDYKKWKFYNNEPNIEDDPFYTFSFIMNESEKRSHKSYFYFIADHSAVFIDGWYYLNDKAIIKLLRQIDFRGHEIGLHASYNSYLKKDQIKKEATLLQKVMIKNDIGQKLRGGRQHYLRWKTPETFQNWEYAGMQYDSTLGYADMAGFRCGTCWEFPAYDLINRKQLNLIERPLIAMESSVTALRYMNKGYGEEAFQVFKSLKDTCRKYNGDFVLLWHNSELLTEEQKRLYLSVLDA